MASGTLIVPQLTRFERGQSTSWTNDGNAADASHAPATVNLSVNNFSVYAVFTTFTFNQKPYLDFVYVGRYAPSRERSLKD